MTDHARIVDMLRQRVEYRLARMDELKKQMAEYQTIIDGLTAESIRAEEEIDDVRRALIALLEDKARTEGFNIVDLNAVDA